jgi:alpha-1,2-mannosyltransferase
MDRANHLASASRRWLTVGLLLFFVVLSVQYAGKVRKGDRADSRSAFLRWRTQILDLGAGVNVYERHGYPNPPIMGLLLWPLVQLPPLAGSLLWFFLKAGMAVLAVHWVLQLVESPDRPFPGWARLLAVVLSVRPLVGDLTHGNVNLFILFLVAAALRAFCCRHQKSAGLLLALAIACKVTPALFVPYFAWKRAWKTLAACAAGLVLFLLLVPAGFLGPRWNVQLLESWTEHMVLPYVLGGRVTTEHQNQSLPGVVHRLATPAASFSAYQESGYMPTEFHNLVSLSPAQASWLVRGLMVLFAGLVAWSCRTPLATGERWRLAAEFSLVVLGMLLFSERTWKHHYVTLILPVAVLVYRGSAGVSRRLAFGTLSAATLLMAATGTGIPGIPERVGKLAEVYGAYLWANLLLVGALIVLLRTRDEVPPPAGPHIIEARVSVQAERGQRPAAPAPVA